MGNPAWVWRRILHVDLGDGNGRVVKVAPRVYELLYGGRGLASLLLYHVGGDPDPLSPENPLVIAPGLLTGSGLSTASKTIIAARSPLTGILGRSSVGARLGAELRYAGFDALVVTGSLDEWGILVIRNDEISIIDARGLEGAEITRARRKLRETHRGYASCVIGPAGENLSRISMIDCDGRQAGRTGLGAVMGSKKLKAILVKGTRKPVPGDPEGLRSLRIEWAKTIPTSKSSRTLIEYGTPIVVNLTEPQGVFPSLNWRRSTLSWCPSRDEAREEFASYAKNHRVSRNPCIHCNRPCSQVVEAVNPLTGEREALDGPEYELLYSLGSNLGFCKPENAASLALLADELGFDGISLGTTLAWLLESIEKGIVSEDLLAEYKDIGWGRLESIAKLIVDMAYRSTRLASILADGEARASEILGGSEHAIHVKGLSLPAYDARGLKGLALGYAVSSRGGDHLTSGMYALELGGRLWIYERIDPLETRDKPSIVRAMENLFAAYDNLGVCKFSRYELPPSRLAKAVTVLLGEEHASHHVLLAGERTITLERILNLRWGLKPESDTLPPRLLNEPISDGPRSGERIDRETLEDMVREYYMLRGWDPERGEPYRETLEILGLSQLLSGTPFITT